MKRDELRNKLLDNGYRPLPLLDKGIRIKGWVRDEITREWLARYARQARYANTGIRCDDLIAFDIDILDEDLAMDAEEHIEHLCGRTDLCRFGQAPKRLLLYRVDGAPAVKSARTGRYGGHMVELLAGRGRQFAAFGIHPGTGEPYYWDRDVSPLTVPYADLPAVSVEKALQALEEVDQWFKTLGLPQERRSLSAGLAGVNEYDLTADTEVMVDGKVQTWSELRDRLDGRGVFGNLKREDGEFGDSDGVHFYLATGSGQPCAHDFPRDCTHWDATVSPALAQALPPQPPTTVFTPAPLQELIEHWVLLHDATVRPLAHPQRSFDLAKFKQAHMHWQVPAPTAQNPMRTEPAVNAWQRDPNTLRAAIAELRPDAPDKLFVQDGRLRVFNTYRRPDLPSEGGEIDTVLEFIEHLIPKPDERDLFWNWHALKVANPGWRMHALVMVTPTFGTGRGTWGQILERLFGPEYVREVELKHLIGSGSQAQYNEFLSSSLLITVPEALEEREDMHRWSARHAAYERLKLICDPVAGRMHIARKYGKNTTERIFASVQISTNHSDALAIEPGDRRLVVLENGDRPLTQAPGDLYSRILAWKDHWPNIGALDRYLRARAERARSEYDPFGIPPETPAKARMLEAAQSDTDIAYEYMLENAKGDVVTPAQWRSWALKASAVFDLDLPPDNKLGAALGAVIAKRGRRLEALGPRQLKVKGRPVRPWIIRNFNRWKGESDRAAIAAEIAKNGDPGGVVVQFPGRG